MATISGEPSKTILPTLSACAMTIAARRFRCGSWRSRITAPKTLSMTLSDLLCYLRAKKGGVFYSDVTEAVDIPMLRLVRAERTLSISDLTAEELGRLAEYFAAPLDE